MVGRGDRMPTYSISVRLQRTTTEECFVSVPVTDDVMQEPDADGVMRLDAAKVIAAAVELGEASAEWTQESRQVTPHPIQKPPSDADDADTADTSESG